MRLTTSAVLAATTVGVCACGMGMGNHDGSRVDAQAYAVVALQIGTAASAYGTAAAATLDPATCHSAHMSYDVQVHPMVDRMRSMSAAMDNHMGMMGGGAMADMTCGVDAIADELAHHDSVACTSTMTANHDEAARHVAAMVAWADHQHARADQMRGMTGGGGMMGSSSCGGMDPLTATTAMMCRRNGDGTFTLRP